MNGSKHCHPKGLFYGKKNTTISLSPEQDWEFKVYGNKVRVVFAGCVDMMLTLDEFDKYFTSKKRKIF